MTRQPALNTRQPGTLLHAHSKPATGPCSSTTMTPSKIAPADTMASGNPLAPYPWRARYGTCNVQNVQADKLTNEWSRIPSLGSRVCLLISLAISAVLGNCSAGLAGCVANCRYAPQQLLKARQLLVSGTMKQARSRPAGRWVRLCPKPKIFFLFFFFENKKRKIQ